MLKIDQDRGEVSFLYKGVAGEIGGRISYFENMLGELTFNLNGRTVPFQDPLSDISMVLAAVAAELMAESKKSESDGPPTDDEALKTEPKPRKKGYYSFHGVE
jgi:hypothetical protein